jgi:hypothetical protein
MRTRLLLALVLLASMACGTEGASVTTPTPTRSRFRAAEPTLTPGVEETEEPSPTPTEEPDDATPSPTPVERCRNSVDATCGKFGFDPNPEEDTEATVKITMSPEDPEPDELVTFKIVAVDEDSSTLRLGTYSLGKGQPSATASDSLGACPRAYGKWDPPAEDEGTLSKTLTHRYEAGTYQATFYVVSRGYGDKHDWPEDPPGDEDGECIDPYAGKASAKITFTVESPPTPSPTATT